MKDIPKTRRIEMNIAFQGEVLPESCRLVGYSWLLEYFDLLLPLRQLCCISDKRLEAQRIEKGVWLVFDAQIKVEEKVTSHLEFCLKYENFDLLLLKSILKACSKDDITLYIENNPKRILTKKIWFLYEFLLEGVLPIEDLPAGKYDDLLDTKKYIVNKNAIKSKRHKVNNNLLGNNDFCPVVRKTPTLESYLAKNLDAEISHVIGSVSGGIMRRAASFLLLSDSKASFEIEGERPPKNRIDSWGKIINEAGRKALSVDEIQRLHAILLPDARFTKIGLREEGVFLGDRDRDNKPVPEFIGARSDDLASLIQAWVNLDDKLSIDGVNPIIQAVIVAFSFVYIHPLEDGNGRIHRYLLHHVLASRGFYPKGMIFPISNVILDELEKYKEVLVSHTSPLMQSIEWRSTQQGNVETVNETKDLYSFFDCTKSCEFIYHCVEKTIKETLPDELRYLSAFDKAYDEINKVIEMPDNKIKTLITLIVQNDGRLSKNKRDKLYAQIQEQEVEEIEEIVKECFLLSS